MPNLNGLASLAQNVLKALVAELNVLERLQGCFSEYLAALKAQQPEQLSDTTDAVSEATRELERSRQQRERQMRLLGRLLRLGDEVTLVQIADGLQTMGLANEAAALRQQRQAVRTAAQATGRAAEKAEYALQYAARLSRQLVQAATSIGAPPQPAAYTAGGYLARPSTQRSMLDHVG